MDFTQLVNAFDPKSADNTYAGQGSQGDLFDLQKALSAGDQTGREVADSATASGAPLKVESLEGSLKVITFTEQSIKLWKGIPRKPAYNTVEEYNQLVSYGGMQGGFNREGELPLEEDSIYTRRAQLVKYLGTTRSVTHPMQLVRTQPGVNAVAQEIKNGTLWILRKIDQSLTKADTSIVGEEFNGLYAQHKSNDAYTSLSAYLDSEIIVDMRGALLSETAIEKAAGGIIENFGLATDLYAPPGVLSGFATRFYGSKFINPNSAEVMAGIMGQKVEKVQTQFGEININWDVFMNPNPAKKTTSAASSVYAPAAPTAVNNTSVAPVAATAANTKWASADAGDYIYAVSALNRYGESALTVMNSTPATIVANGAVDLTFTETAGPNLTTGYRVYRSAKNPVSAATTTFYPLFDVSKASVVAGYDGGAAGVTRDLNRFLPGMAECFMIQNDDTVFEFAQLAPLMKMDLAIVSPSYRFMVLLYGTPLLYAPKRMVRFINVGIAKDIPLV